MAIYSVSVPIFSVLTMIVSVRGQSEVVANVQDSTPCYGSIVDVTCSFPKDLKQYLISTPSWKRNGALFQPDAITHTIINYNRTLHILRINITGEDFLSRTLEYACFLVKMGDERDESDVHIAPQERPLAPVLENVTLSEEGTTVSWDHDNKCFHSCSFTYNATLFRVIKGGNSTFMNTTSTTQPNVTFVDLIVSETYKLFVIAQAICANVSTLTSNPLEVEFEGEEYRTPSPPTKNVATVPLVTASPTNELDLVAIIVGVVASGVVVAGLITAIVIIAVICHSKNICQCGKHSKKEDTDTKHEEICYYDGVQDQRLNTISNGSKKYCRTWEEFQRLLDKSEHEDLQDVNILNPELWRELRKRLPRD